MQHQPDPLLQARAGCAPSVVQAVRAELLRQRWPAQVSFTDGVLRIRLLASFDRRLLFPQVTTARIFHLVKRLQIPHLHQVEIQALRGSQLLWQRHLRLQPDPWERSPVNGWALPLAFGVALVINHIGPLQLLHLPFHVWIHEFGHALVAWWSGHRALPLPFGWTNISLQKDPFVYFGILFLLGLLFWSGWKEKIVWLRIVAVVLALVQFYMTWIMDKHTKELLFALSGVGGEFCLSTFLIVCFYLRFPDSWRWDFWRFLVLGIAATSLWRSFWQWHTIRRGLGSIPWGTLWGGQGDTSGDMNRLQGDFGWSTDQMIQTYSSLGNLCVFVVLATYVVFLLRLNPGLWLDLQTRLILWADDLMGSRKSR